MHIAAQTGTWSTHGKHKISIEIIHTGKEISLKSHSSVAMPCQHAVSKCNSMSIHSTSQRWEWECRSDFHQYDHNQLFTVVDWNVYRHLVIATKKWEHNIRSLNFRDLKAVMMTHDSDADTCPAFTTNMIRCWYWLGLTSLLISDMLITWDILSTGGSPCNVSVSRVGRKVSSYFGCTC